MRCITLWQPWATLIAIGAKQFETRSWAVSFRDQLAIHAAKRPADARELNPAIVSALAGVGIVNLQQLTYGCVVCTVNLIDCLRTEDAIAQGLISDAERAFGDYRPGRFAWQLSDVQPVDNMPARGGQGLWHWQPPT